MNSHTPVLQSTCACTYAVEADKPLEIVAEAATPAEADREPAAMPAVPTPSVPARTAAALGATEPSGSSTQCTVESSVSFAWMVALKSPTEGLRGKPVTHDGGVASLPVVTSTRNGADITFPTGSSSTPTT